MELAQIDGLAQALFEQTGDALFLFDPDTNQILNANSTAQRLSGFPVRELLRMSLAELFRSATDTGWKNLLNASRHSTDFHSQEGYFLKAVNDEVGIPVNLTVARLHVRPKALGLITARDIRRQYEAHNQLKRLEGELRRILESISDCLWTAEIDEAGKISYQYLSEEIEAITGLPSSFFLAGFHRWYDIVHPEDLPRWSAAMTRQKTGQATVEEYRVVWPDGTSRWVREKVLVSRGTAEHGSIRLDGVLTDISERKRMEREFKDSENRFRVFLNHDPILAFIKDGDGRYFYVNEPFRRFVQKTSDEILSRKDADLFAAEVAATWAERDARTLAHGQPIQTTEKLRGPDGTDHTWYVTRIPSTDGTGRRFLGAIAVDVEQLTRLSASV